MPDDFDPQGFFADLSDGGPRLSLDQYRDFRQVFLGSDAGKRVLHDLMVHGHIYRSSVALHTPHPELRIHVNEGERNFALWVLDTLHKEPKAPPLRQNTREVDDG